MKQLYITFILLSFIALSCSETDTAADITIPTGSHKSIRNIKLTDYQELPTCYIEAVVISDRTSKNFDSKHAYVMDKSERGILLEFKSSHSFNLGDKIIVKLYKLRKSNGSSVISIQNIPLTRATVSESNVSIDPIEVTISSINNNPRMYESCLIKLYDVELSKQSGNTFIYQTLVTQNSGYYSREIDLITEPNATFADTEFPTEKLDLTAILTRDNGYNYNTMLKIRKLNDLVIGKTSFNIDFNNTNPISNNSGWDNIDNANNSKWSLIYGGFFGNQQVAGINSYYGAVDAWLISPTINFNQFNNYFLELKSAYNSENKYGEFSVLYSDNYSDDVNSANWTPIEGTFVNSSNDVNIWIHSSPINLSNKTGFGHIAFRITKADNSSYDPTIVIDNIVLSSYNN